MSMDIEPLPRVSRQKNRGADPHVKTTVWWLSGRKRPYLWDLLQKVLLHCRGTARCQLDGDGLGLGRVHRSQDRCKLGFLHALRHFDQYFHFETVKNPRRILRL